MRVSRVIFGKRKVWVCDTVLDQLDTPHCVGFACADFGNTLPIDSGQTNADGHAIYYAAKVFDDEPREENGSTIRSGAKALQQRGMIQNYAFAKTVDELATWLDAKGPVVMGTTWYSAMMDTDKKGFVHAHGRMEGGHAWALIGYDFRNPFNRYFVGLNSWGVSWGQNGRFNISTGDLRKLLWLDGEAMTAVEIPCARKTE